MRFTTILLTLIPAYSAAQKPVIWDSPTCLMQSAYNITLEKVEMQDSATVLTLHMTDVETDEKYVDSRLFLSDGQGREYQLTGSCGVQIGEQDSLPQAGPIRFTLQFQPLPQGETAFDLRDLYERRFELFGIHNAKKTKTATLTAARPDSSTLPDAWTTDTVTICGQLSDYSQEHMPGTMGTSFHLIEDDTASAQGRQTKVNRDGSFMLRYLADRPSIARLEGSGTSIYYYAVPGDTLYMDIDYQRRWLQPALTRSVQGNDTHEALLEVLPVSPHYEHFFWNNRKKMAQDVFFHIVDSLQTRWDGLNNYLAGKYRLTPWECHLLHERTRMTFDYYRLKYLEARQTDEIVFSQAHHQEPLFHQPLTDEEYIPYAFLKNISIEEPVRYMTTASHSNLISSLISLKPFMYIPHNGQEYIPMLREELLRASGGQDPELAIRVVQDLRRMSVQPEDKNSNP